MLTYADVCRDEEDASTSDGASVAGSSSASVELVVPAMPDALRKGAFSRPDEREKRAFSAAAVAGLGSSAEKNKNSSGKGPSGGGGSISSAALTAPGRWLRRAMGDKAADVVEHLRATAARSSPLSVRMLTYADVC